MGYVDDNADELATRSAERALLPSIASATPPVSHGTPARSDDGDNVRHERRDQRFVPPSASWLGGWCGAARHHIASAHTDYLVASHLHHLHAGHCDDHGRVTAA